MPIITRPLDAHGLAFVEVIVQPAMLRRKALAQGLVAVPPTNAVLGLIDPGAAISAIDQRLVGGLNLVPSGFVRVVTPHNPVAFRAPAYKIDLAILDPLGSFLVLKQRLSIADMPLVHTGSEVLIGCDVLADGQFIHNGFNKTFSLAF